MAMHPRRAALVGIVFVAIAGFYTAFQVAVNPSRIDLTGITLLVALGAAMSLMAFVLFSAIQKG
jgi:hypothetical protein